MHCANESPERAGRFIQAGTVMGQQSQVSLVHPLLLACHSGSDCIIPTVWVSKGKAKRRTLPDSPQHRSYANATGCLCCHDRAAWGNSHFVTKGPECRTGSKENGPRLLCRSKNHGVSLLIMSKQRLVSVPEPDTSPNTIAVCCRVNGSWYRLRRQ